MNDDNIPTVLHVLPGDVLVVYAAHSLVPKRAEEILEPLKKLLPEDAKILVCSDGMRLGILRGLKPDALGTGS